MFYSVDSLQVRLHIPQVVTGLQKKLNNLSSSVVMWGISAIGTAEFGALARSVRLSLPGRSEHDKGRTVSISFIPGCLRFRLRRDSSTFARNTRARNESHSISRMKIPISLDISKCSNMACLVCFSSRCIGNPRSRIETMAKCEDDKGGEKVG